MVEDASKWVSQGRRQGRSEQYQKDVLLVKTVQLHPQYEANEHLSAPAGTGSRLMSSGH